MSKAQALQDHMDYLTQQWEEAMLNHEQNRNPESSWGIAAYRIRKEILACEQALRDLRKELDA